MSLDFYFPHTEKLQWSLCDKQTDRHMMDRKTDGQKDWQMDGQVGSHGEIIGSPAEHGSEKYWWN